MWCEFETQNYGYILEDLIIDKVKSDKSLCFDNIMLEKSLIKTYGPQSSGIDFLFIHNNRALGVQVKTRRTRRKENLYVDNFLKSLSFMEQKLGITIDGLWATRVAPFDDNKLKMEMKNVLCISCYDSMYELIDCSHRIISNWFEMNNKPCYKNENQINTLQQMITSYV